MDLSNVIYLLHQMRDVAISMWQSSPNVIVGIAVALAAATYFVYRR